MNKRPDKSEYPSFYAGYVNLVNEDDLRAALIDSGSELVRLFGHHETNLTLHDKRYQADKWNISEVLLHIIDSENVFVNRALWAARREPSPLPGFNQNQWIENLSDREFSVNDLIQWFRLQRQNTVMFFEHLIPAEYDLTVEANNHLVSVRALGYIIAGHTRHHATILRERYLEMQ